jgi:hypothetical protein
MRLPPTDVPSRTQYRQSVRIREAVLRQFLELHHLRFRSFPMIRHHIGGFPANDLRKHLVRSGAVRFMAADGTELWALRERVIDEFRHSMWKLDQSPLNKASIDELFPSAFKSPDEF